MAQEATSKATASQILSTVFAPGNNDRMAGVRDDLATVLTFFSDKVDFERGLMELSKKLWELYSRKDEDAKNKFSTSVIQLGVQMGFPAQNQIILTAGDEDYLTYLNSGWLIKDEMDLLHGEYSHSLQWLAAACAGLNLTRSVGELYRALGKDYFKSSINVWRYNKPIKQNDLGKVHVWAYLVDSFPMKMVGDLNQHNANYSLFTDNYRCPQNVMSYLLTLQSTGHFLARYFQWRYLKRSFMDAQGNISTGATIKNWSTRYEKNPNYDPMKSGAGFVRNGSPVAPDLPKQKLPPVPGMPTQYAPPAPSTQGKPMTQVTFHGKSAWVHGEWNHI